MPNDREPPPEILKIRNDLSLDREGKIDAVIAWLANRADKPLELWELILLCHDEPLGFPLRFEGEEAAWKALAQVCRGMWTRDRDDPDDHDEMPEWAQALDGDDLIFAYFDHFPEMGYRIPQVGPRRGRFRPADWRWLQDHDDAQGQGRACAAASVGAGGQPRVMARAFLD